MQTLERITLNATRLVESSQFKDAQRVLQTYDESPKGLRKVLASLPLGDLSILGCEKDAATALGVLCKKDVFAVCGLERVDMIVLEFAAVPAVKIMRTNGGVSNNQALVVDIFRVRSRAATKVDAENVLDSG